MTFSKLTTLAAIIFLVLATLACKKKEETTVSPSLSGSLSFNVEEFVAPNQIMKMTPKGVTHPEGKGIGYYWKVTPDMSTADTTRLETGLSPDGKEADGTFSYQFRDSIATYTVTCTAFASGYSVSSAVKYVTVVDTTLNGSLTNVDISSRDPKFTWNDAYYYTKEAAGVKWLRNNLANGQYGVAYANAAITSKVLGRYYSYDEAIKACPDGWRLPTDKEWIALAASIDPENAVEDYEVIPNIAADFMADAKLNGATMWEYWPTVGDISNSSGMSMISSGYANLGQEVNGEYPTAQFFGLYEYAVFWTADKVEGDEDMAYYRYLFCDQPGMYIGKADTKTFGASVRCVKE